MKTLIITKNEIEKFLTVKNALSVVEEAFEEHGIGKTQLPAKLYLFFDKYNGDLRIMPAYLGKVDMAGCKIVNVHPNNPEKYSLPTVMALIILNDPKTGFPICIMEGTYITNMRTGAAGGVAIKYLVRRDSKVLGMIGTGAQAKTQFLAAIEVFPHIREVLCYSNSKVSVNKFVEELKSFNIHFEVYNEARGVCEGSDIIITTTPSREPIVKDEWIYKGTHINAIGADAPGKQELDSKILMRSKIVIDSWEQAAHSGEINVKIKEGIIDKKIIYAELGEIVAGKKKGRRIKKKLLFLIAQG